MLRKDTGNLAQSQRQIVADIVWHGAIAGLGDADAVERLRMRLDGVVPWQETVAEAQRLGLAPLFHLGLHASPILQAMVPSSAADSLRVSTLISAAHVTRLERACAAVVAAATTAGIQVLVLKGLALGVLLYPSVAARPMGDVDLLVAAADREGLTAILHKSGYRNDLRGKEDFYPPGMAYSIDVHTGLVNTTRVPAREGLWSVSFEDLWASSQTVMLGNVPGRTLGPRDTLLHLAIHTVHHHGFAGMLWMIDLLACLWARSFSPDDFEAAPPPVRRSLWYCLEVLAFRGQDPVPRIRAAVQPDRIHLLEQCLLAAIARGEVPAAIRYAFTLACFPRWAAKGAFLRQLLFPAVGVFTDGFKDAGNSAPSRGQYWSVAMKFCREALRAALPRKNESRKKATGRVD